jgi:hypothetical protein
MERPGQLPDAVPRKPNPGSDDAISAGCLCPVMDNGHGRCAPYPPDGWWITVGCPVHAPGGVRVRKLDAA